MKNILKIKCILIITFVLFGNVHLPKVKSDSLDPTYYLHLPTVYNNYCRIIPQMTYPHDGLTDLPLIFTLSWDIPNVYLQIAKDAEFNQLVYDVFVADHRYDYYDMEPNTTYFWRLRYCENIAGSYSETRSFKTVDTDDVLPAPVLQSPPNGSIVTPPVCGCESNRIILKWNEVQDAYYYIVYFRKVGEPEQSIIAPNTFLQFLRVDLELNTTYIWSVKPITFYATGTESEVWSFTTPP